ncbi:hypothetical protein [Candidatus Planktophila dulcis]|uniref:hypothetical protein n=1 Tax=Candidatus Planktophila dulcis TaxID=1884914 RepID=UPI003CEF1692
MRKHLRFVALLIPMVLVASNSYAAVKAGSACSKVGSKSVSGGKSYTCVKSGKKLVWDRGVLVAKPSVAKPTPAPSASASAAPKPSSTPKPAPTVANITFENLLENNASVSYTAWKRTSDIVSASASKTGTLTVFTGPGTKPFFEDITYAMNQVSKMYPGKAEPTEVLWIRYKYADLSWAENMAKEKLSAVDYNQIARNQGGNLASSNCGTKSANCRGAYQQTGPSGIALVMQGVENSGPAEPLRMTTGMLEAHEYFHALQRIPIMNKGVQIWPHAWWCEGGAEWAQNMAINAKDYEGYKTFLRGDCAWSCAKLSESELAEFLSTANDNFVPPKFDQFLNYSFGSHVIEILVAMKGPDVLIDMYAEMGKGTSFNDAFKGFFGIAWTDAIPVLAKSVYKTLQS